MTLRVSSVTKTYGTGDGARDAISDVSLEVAPREFVSIVGPSGCGKSTLLMIMAGLLKASRGTVSLDDRVVNGPPTGLSVVFQDYSRSLFPWMTVGKNVAMALQPSRRPRREVRRRVEHALDSVGLAGSAGLYPWQMSGGMQQRAALARALVVSPEVMLMDEPFAAVDAQTRIDLEDLVLRMRDEYGVTIVLVTHDIDEAVYVGDRVLVMAAKPGRIIADVEVDLGPDRDQVATKMTSRYAELRRQVFELVMRKGARPAPAAPAVPPTPAEPEAAPARDEEPAALDA
ncbi:MAG: ABC transporter ATP-binding protein [Acidimicrobiia bacterium]